MLFCLKIIVINITQKYPLLNTDTVLIGQKEKKI